MEGRLLMLQRPKENAHFPGYWECPGGKMEPGEEQTEALSREVRQETGLKILDVTWFHFSVPYIYTRRDGNHKGLTCIPVFGTSYQTGNDELILSAEHSAFKWVTYEEMLKLDLTPPVRNAANEMKAQLIR